MAIEQISAPLDVLECPFCARRPTIKFVEQNSSGLSSKVKVDYPGHYMVVACLLDFEKDISVGCGISMSGWSWDQIKEKWNKRGGILCVPVEEYGNSPEKTNPARYEPEF